MKQQLKELELCYKVLGVIDLDAMTEDYEIARVWLESVCRQFYKKEFDVDERIVFTQTSDRYTPGQAVGLKLRTLQRVLNDIDISNCFVIVASTNPDLNNEISELATISTDPVSINCIIINDNFTRHDMEQPKYESYRYGSSTPIKIRLDQLNDRQQFLLTKSKTFCIYPWMHMHAWPTGEAWPCCHAEMAAGPVGNCRTDTMKTIWNSEKMRSLRKDMLSETPNEYCVRCYEQEESGFFTGRQSANKHHGHQISRIDATHPDGTCDDFEMTYWDVRFSNLCNLSCRSCGHIFSTSWYKDQVKLAGPEWAKNNKVMNYAGRHKTDMWEQLLEHIDYVEQIYFAGGEPLMMEEHYLILEELERRGRFDVRLIYNTNFTEVKLKDRYVFDYWKKFDSVAIGASLDAMGPRAEYIRKGTDWDQVERNRVRMMEICPDVDFYISPTLSILNAWHVPDFHKDWVNKGYIRPQDLNINILQDPIHYRIDIATKEYKQILKDKFTDHLEWLRPLDQLKRATVGFESAINFMMSTDNTSYIDQFWLKSHQLDEIRKEKLLEVLPELSILK
jgi:MoaA/NifB/PqqE/SkfB family radical SAM enzyme